MDSAPATSLSPPSLRWARLTFAGKLGAIKLAAAGQRVRDAGGQVEAHVHRMTTHVVVGMGQLPIRGDGRLHHKLERARELNRRGRRIAILSELAFLDLLGGGASDAALATAYSLDQVSRIAGVGQEVVRQWEQFGLVRSRGGGYDFRDIVCLQTIGELLQQGVSLDAIARSVARLFRTVPGSDRPLAELQMVAARQTELLARHRGTLMTAEGQLVFDFEPPEPADSPPVALADREATADEWLQRGLELEDGEQFEDAVAAYRQALQLQSFFPVAHFNLGTVLQALGRVEEAADAYWNAVEQDPQFAVAWYNLSDALEEVDDLAGSERCLRRALAVEPLFADACFNLALLLERTGRGRDASEFWARYLTFDRDSAWAETARQHLSNCPA